jgi:hypothetical protein
MTITETEPTITGEQFAANKHWSWSPGMSLSYLDIDGDRVNYSSLVISVRTDGTPVIDLRLPIGAEAEPWPNTDDHATLGCIEHGLVPAALQDPDACLCFNPRDRTWYVYSPKHDDCATGKGTKPAALLAALDEADDIVRRSTDGIAEMLADIERRKARAVQAAVIVEEEFADLDGPEDYDGDWDPDGLDDERAMQRLHAYDPDSVPDHSEVPTDPKLCTRPSPAQTVAARGFLETMRQRDADREAQRIAKLQGKVPT